MAEDKQAHFAIGAVAALLAFFVTGTPLVGFAVACCIGGLKEIRDSFGHGQVEVADFAWTCAGAALPMAVVWAVTLAS